MTTASSTHAAEDDAKLRCQGDDEAGRQRAVAAHTTSPSAEGGRAGGCERRHRRRVRASAANPPQADNISRSGTSSGRRCAIYFFGATRSTSASTAGCATFPTSRTTTPGTARIRGSSPSHKPYQEFESGEEINNWLLCNPEVRAYIDGSTRGNSAKIAMVFFDAETETSAGTRYDLILPPPACVSISTQDRHHAIGQRGRCTERAERADEDRGLGGPVRRREKAGLGDELVVQTPYGDSGKTTFFISSEADWRKHSADIVGQEIKVMRRINNRRWRSRPC